MVAGRSRHADFSGLSRAISLQPGEQVATTCQNRNWKTKPHSINFQLDRRVSLVKGILGWDDDTAGNDMEPVDEACCEAVAVADEVEALRPLIPSCPPPTPTMLVCTTLLCWSVACITLPPSSSSLPRPCFICPGHERLQQGTVCRQQSDWTIQPYPLVGKDPHAEELET